MSVLSSRPLTERVPRSLVHLLIVLSVTNFLYLHEFQAVLRSVDLSTSYYRAQPFYWPVAASFFGSLAVVAAVSFIVVEVAFRRGWLSETGLFRIGGAFVLYRLLTLIPLFVSGITSVDLSYFQESYTVVVVAAVAVAAFISLAPRLSAKIGKPAVLLVVPLLFFQLLTFGWRAAHLPSSAQFADGPTLSTRDQGSKVHIVWIVFDELDYELSLDLRPNSVKMPEFDRLRSESLSATNAHSPGEMTSISFPALLTGRQVDDAKPRGPDDLYLTVSSTQGKRHLLWRAQPTMFSFARDHGLNAAIVGWHHPYCRMFNSSLVDCFWTPNVDVLNSLRLELLIRQSGPLFLLPGWWGMSEPEQYDFVAREQQVEYKKTLDHALNVLANSDVNLTLLHWLIPHPPGIYDRNRDRLADHSGSDYFDNLELVDQALGQIREKLQSAGFWDDSAIIVSGDHPLRENLWKDRPTWTREEAQLCAKRKDPRVPLLIKVPHQRTSAVYIAPVNTVLTYDLLIHWMQGKAQTLEKVRAFLDQNRLRFPIPQKRGP